MCDGHLTLHNRAGDALSKGPETCGRHVAVLGAQMIIHSVSANPNGKEGENVDVHTASFSTSATRHVPFHQRPSGWPICMTHASCSRFVSRIYASPFSRLSSCLDSDADLASGDASGTSCARACSGASAARGEVFFLEDDAMVWRDEMGNRERSKKSIHKIKVGDREEKRRSVGGGGRDNLVGLAITSHHDAVLEVPRKQSG